MAGELPSPSLQLFGMHTSQIPVMLCHRDILKTCWVEAASAPALLPCVHSIATQPYQWQVRAAALAVLGGWRVIAAHCPLS
jgi:hypothetical protein